jgi:transposase
VERFFAWMQWDRRLLTRWESYPANFLGLVQLGAICILLKQF